MKTMKLLVPGKQFLSSLMMAALMVGMLGFTVPAKAASEPEIDKVEHRGSRSVELRVKDERFVSDRVRIKVEVTNKRTGRLVKTDHFTKTLNSDGKTTVRVGGLSPRTEFRFKVRVKEFGKDKDYRGSDSKTITTKA